jgi:tryptophan synthase alpha subunit
MCASELVTLLASEATQVRQRLSAGIGSWFISLQSLQPATGSRTAEQM